MTETLQPSLPSTAPPLKQSARGDTHWFFQRVLPSTGYYFIAIRKTGGGFAHHAADSIAHAAAMARQFDQQGQTVFHACASYHVPAEFARQIPVPQGQALTPQRTQKNVASLKAFWLDVDVGPDENKYPSAQEAIKGVAEFLKKTCLPIPLVVASGGGLHCYWPLQEDITSEQWYPIAQALKLLAAASGFKTDPSRTADSASVLRPIGTHNRKHAVVRPVELVRDCEPIPLTSFRAAIFAACTQYQIDPTNLSRVGASAGTAGAVQRGTFLLSRGEVIADKCGQVRQMRDTGGNVPEPVWYGVIGVLAKTEGGERIIHEWSTGYPRYSVEETNRKISQVSNVGPTTCAKLKSLNPDGCRGCPHDGKVTSPIQLGRIDEREELNDQYAWITKQAEIFRIEQNDFIRPDRFRIELANKPPVKAYVNGSEKDVPLSTAWLGWPQRRCHRDVIYEPGKPAIVNDCFNLWRGWGCVPVPGDVSPWNQLMEFVFAGDPKARTFFEQWVAYQFQHPGEKLNTAVVLWSRNQGVGKTLIGETIGALFGGDNFTVITATELHSDFNSWARGKQFVLGEENASNDHRADANRLKHLITGETIQINEKYQPRVTLRNTLNFLFTSNHPDAFHLDLHDRRFFVWEITGERLSDEFYADFVRWRDSEKGLPALMHYLQQISPTGFNPKAAAPMTRAKSDMVDLSRSDLERWLFELVNQERANALSRSEVIPLEQLANHYALRTTNRTTTTAIGKALSRLGLKHSRRIMVNGLRVSLTAVARPDYWAKVDNETWAAEYAKQLS